MLRKIRIVAACFSFALSVAALAMWIRGYSFYDSVSYFGDHRMVNFNSALGRLTITSYHSPNSELAGFEGDHIERHRIEIASSRANRNLAEFLDALRSFHIYVTAKQCILEAEKPLDFWSLSAFFATLALLLKPSPRYRFSLLEMLMLTTISALTVGGILALFRLAQ